MQIPPLTSVLYMAAIEQLDVMSCLFDGNEETLSCLSSVVSVNM